MRSRYFVFIALAAVVLMAGIAVLNYTRVSGRNNATAGSLVEAVRKATANYKDIQAAEAAGYGLFHACVSGPQEGAMGVHYVNGDLVSDGKVDASRPEALMYEYKDGRYQLVGVEYVVLAEDWNAANETPPTLNGQLFSLTGAPNRYGIPAFYALHVWAWKDNPNGMFADWNPRVTCEQYTGGAAH